MSFHTVMVVFMLFFALAGCGQDIARKQTSKETGKVPQTGNQDVTKDTNLIASQIHRTRGVTITSYLGEIALTLANNLPSAYRAIPDITLDDEGTESKNVLTVAGLGRPGTVCGSAATFTGIDSRITDCSAKNGDRAIWTGQLYGSSGESSWKLVALMDSTREFWLDDRTGMVWSDVMATDNWCKASGNKQEASGSTIDCSTAGEDQNLCSSLENFGTNIRWRLPTRNDYLQADLDGLRFVMKKGSPVGSWTATVKAGVVGRDHAWVYHMTDGTLTAEEMGTERLIRCIGTPVR
jgi:hypothetical protein